MSQPGFHHESSVLRGFENELSGINPSGVAPAIVLLTPHLAENDTALIRKIAYAFHQQGSSVIWRIRADAGAEKGTMYVPPSGDCSANGKLINRNKYFGRTHAVGEFFRRLQGKLSKTLYMSKGQRLEESLTKILSKLKPGSSVLMAFPKIEDFHDIFLVVASLQLDRPMPCTLHVLSKDFFLPELSGSWRSVARRLQSGSPFETIMFHSDGRLPLSNEKEDCTIDFPIHELTAAECESTTLIKRFGFVAPAEQKAHHATIQAMRISKFGPIAIQVSALWGRVGSTAIFEAQARYLIERGFFLVRVFVDHHPRHDSTRNERIEQMVDEDVQNVRPHVFFVVERNTNSDSITKTETDPQFASASPLLRSTLLLSDARAVQSETELLWLGARANVIVVNHLFHVAFAKRLTSAPMVLETHDICARLLDLHGIPSFVPIAEDSEAKRMEEEQAIWRQVDACVNISPDDHEQVRRYASKAVLARPYFSKRILKRHCWPSVIAKNHLIDNLQLANEFDLMLWGSPHAGNSDSIKWFVNHVLAPDVRFKDRKVAIVGRVCDLLPADIGENSQVCLFGFIDCIDDLIARSKILVIPDLDGTGISIKAMEVLALGKCFSSTQAGFRGIDTGCADYHPSKDAESLADDLAKLLSSPSERSTRARLARTLYETNFSLSAYSRAWDEVIRTTIPHLQEQLNWTASEAPISSISDLEKNNMVSQLKLSESAAPRLSVVVCTHNRYNVLPDAIDSILHQQVDASLLELIVVDNSGDQRHAAEFARRYEEAPLLYLLEPIQGLSNARNVGLSKARGRIVAFIDDDAIADPKWGEHIMRAFELYGLDKVGVVGGRVLPLWVEQRPKWLGDKLLSYLSVIDWGGELRELNKENWLVGCNIAYNRDALLQIGGFSRALGRYGDGVLLSNEEIEVSEKLNAQGLISVYSPEAMVHHVIDPDRLSRAWFRRRAAWQAVSDLVKNSQCAADAFRQSEHRLQWALQNQSRGIGFFSDESSSEEFEEEVGLIYDLTLANLCGGAAMPKSPERDSAHLHLLLWRAFLRREAAKFLCTIGLSDSGAKKFNQAQGEIAHLQAKMSEKSRT